MKTIEIKDSTAIQELKVEENSVYITYKSNIDKEYEFNCKNTEEFIDKVSKTIDNEESMGKLVNNCIKQGELVAVTK